MNLMLEEREELKRLYKLIIEKELEDELIQERVNIIHYLEQGTKQKFKNTEDFIKKMEHYFARQAHMRRNDLKRARKEKGWTQKTMADYLGISRVYLAQMESGIKPLNRGVVDFLHKTYATPLET